MEEKQKEKNKWDLLIKVEGIAVIWFVAFLGSLTLVDGGRTASVLAFGNFYFAFLAVPAGITGLIQKKKGAFSPNWEGYAVPLSVTNIIIGVLAWIGIIFVAIGLAMKAGNMR